MLFTVGYQRLFPADLATLASRLDATVIDCRTNTTSRVKQGFTRADLQARFGARYEDRGAALGGRGDGPTPAGLQQLVADVKRGARVLLLCSEEAPGNCHRHFKIAMPLVDLEPLHVYQDHVIRAADLAAALRADAEDGGDHDVPSRPLDHFFHVATIPAVRAAAKQSAPRAVKHPYYAAGRRVLEGAERPAPRIPFVLRIYYRSAGGELLCADFGGLTRQAVESASFYYSDRGAYSPVADVQYFPAHTPKPLAANVRQVVFPSEVPAAQAIIPMQGEMFSAAA